MVADAEFCMLRMCLFVYVVCHFQSSLYRIVSCPCAYLAVCVSMCTCLSVCLVVHTLCVYRCMRVRMVHWCSLSFVGNDDNYDDVHIFRVASASAAARNVASRCA